MELMRRYLERGLSNVRLERSDGDGAPRITGYGAVFYDPADPGTEFEWRSGKFERIMPEAFDRALREDDVRALVNHDSNRLLGRTSAGTMSLSVDEKGLRYVITPPADLELTRQTVAAIERGDMTGSSFAFVPQDIQWATEEGRKIANIREVQLWDVGPVTYAAYDASTTGLRNVPGVDVLQASYDAWEAQCGADTARKRAQAQAVCAQARKMELDIV